MTFLFLDREKGIYEFPLQTGEEYPLPAWYRSVREIPIEDLGHGDLARACRQRIHLEYVVPIVLKRLQADPLSGELYDGELIVSLRAVPSDYWLKHPGDTLALKASAEEVVRLEATTDDVRRDAQDLARRAGSDPQVQQ